jgi:hypothetical protein
LEVLPHVGFLSRLDRYERPAAVSKRKTAGRSMMG